jgi:hypothetical protein
MRGISQHVDPPVQNAVLRQGQQQICYIALTIEKCAESRAVDRTLSPSSRLDSVFCETAGQFSSKQRLTTDCSHGSVFELLLLKTCRSATEYLTHTN